MGLKKQTINYTFGVIIEKLIPFLLIPVFTRFLGSEEYSNLIMFLTYSGLFTVLIGFSTNNYYIREILDSKSIKQVISKPIWTNILLFLFLFIVSLFLNDHVFILAAIMSFVQAVFSYSLAHYLSTKQSKKYIKISILFSLLSSLLSVFLIYFYPVYESRVFALIFAYLVVFLYFILVEKKFFNELKSVINKTSLFNKEGWIPFLSFCAPLVIHQLSFFFKNGFDRILMNSSETSSYVSTYGLSFQLILPFAVLFGAFNKAFLPHIYEKLNEKEYQYVKKFFNYSWYIVGLSALAFIILYKVPPSIYSYIFGDKFESVSYFLPFFATGTILTLPYLMSNFILFYNRKTISIAVLNIISAGIHILIFISLNSIEYIKYLGVSYLVSQFVLFLSVNILSRKELNKLITQSKI